MCVSVLEVMNSPVNQVVLGRGLGNDKGGKVNRIEEWWKSTKIQWSEFKWGKGWLDRGCCEGFISVVKWSGVKVLVKCVCSSSWSYVTHYYIVCQTVINADSSTLGSFLGLNAHFVFLMFVVYVLYCICHFVCCILFWVLCVTLCFLLL